MGSCMWKEGGGTVSTALGSVIYSFGCKGWGGWGGGGSGYHQNDILQLSDRDYTSFGIIPANSVQQ